MHTIEFKSRGTKTRYLHVNGRTTRRERKGKEKKERRHWMDLGEGAHAHVLTRSCSGHFGMYRARI